MIRGELQARQDLGDLEPELYRIVYESFGEFLDDHARTRFKYHQRTEANILHDYMARATRRILGDCPRVRIIDKPGEAFRLCIDGRYVLKEKKLDDELRSSNIPTQAALSFVNQNGQHLIPDYAVLDPTALILGYQRREVELLESPIYLVCPDGDDVAWDWMLKPGADLAVPVPTDLLAPVPTGRVRPKSGETETRQEPPLEDEVADDEDRDTRAS
jgi:hypothetical protein